MHSFKFMKTKVFFFGEAERESQSAYGSFQNYTFRSLKCGKKATRCIPADLKMFCLLYTEDRITSLRLQLRNFHLGLHLKCVQKNIQQQHFTHQETHLNINTKLIGRCMT